MGPFFLGSLVKGFWVIALGQAERGVRNLKAFLKKSPEPLQLKGRTVGAERAFFALRSLALTGKDITEEMVQDTNIQQRHKRTEI